MKLGVSYNLFDGEELLEGSIKQIRQHVDYVSVVYQTVSNFGNPCNLELVPLLERLKSEGLIDELFEFSPKVNKGGHSNEIQKRNIGLALSQGVNCSHHMSMDSDEYYIPSEFENLKKMLEDGDYDSSFCQMQTYYKSWEYSLNPPEEYYVSLIFKIKPDSDYVMGYPTPVLVDPTRRMSPSNTPLILKREEIQMHHGSYIRDNVRTKLVNSSASVNFNNDIDRIVNHYNTWEYPNKVLWGGLPSTLHNVKKVENLFMKLAVILASHIPSIDKLWVGEDILKKIKENLPNADIFIGVNPSICTSEWVEIIQKYTDKYSITPDNLIINSDASAYQTALRVYKKNNYKEYDLVWFLHTQGTKSGRHEVRENHLKTLLYKKDDVLELFESHQKMGAYGHSLTPLPNCWVDSDWDFYLSRFGLPFVNRPIRAFLVGTMFVIRGHILNNFINNCDNTFFNEILHNPHTNGLGDPWFFERDFIHIVDGFTNHYIYGKYVINNYGIPLDGLNDLEHYEKLLKEWKIKNNLNNE